VKYLFLFNILFAFSLISACSGRKTLAPVSDRTAPSSTKVQYHVVAAGETLYSIAWKYNLDYKNLSKNNGIGRNYRIYPGQKIYLIRTNPALKYRPSKPVSSASSSQSRTETKPKVAPKPKEKRLENKTTVPTKPLPSSNKVFWSWPTRGKVITGFNGNGGLNKGIDIQGNLGEPVLAAASGSVVYAGQGLRGYGKLIIIKHSEKYLSAYAHSRKLNVKEGDTVKAGEKIAEMGSSGTNAVKLHFEIRYDGKPVNPLKYLPQK